MNQTQRIEEIDIEYLGSLGAAELLRVVFEAYGDRAAIGTSLQKTGLVTIDIASKLGIPFRVFFIDTLLNYPETYELLEEVEQRYDIRIERFAPTQEELDELHNAWGQFPHYFARARCCLVRKSLPMKRAQGTLDAWIAGLRADQSDHRRDSAQKVSWVFGEGGRKILKINPLIDWTAEEIDQYTAENDLPYNKLYDYVSP